MELVDAMNSKKELKYIITKSNADTDAMKINNIFEKFVKQNSDRAILVDSLGVVRYISAVKYSEFVMGNSSSGIIEVPSLGKPTINIGDRQRGRIQADSVINCEPNKDNIIDAMELAMSDKFKNIANCVVNPYGDGNTSDKIIKVIKSYKDKKIELKKKFYDVNFKI